MQGVCDAVGAVDVRRDQNPAEQASDDASVFLIALHQRGRHGDQALPTRRGNLVFGDLVSAHGGDGIEGRASRVFLFQISDRGFRGGFILHDDILQTLSEGDLQSRRILVGNGNQTGYGSENPRGRAVGQADPAVFMLAHDEADGARIALQEFLHADQILHFMLTLGDLQKRIVFPFRQRFDLGFIFSFSDLNGFQLLLQRGFSFAIAVQLALCRFDSSVEKRDIRFVLFDILFKFRKFLSVRFLTRRRNGCGDDRLRLLLAERGQLGIQSFGCRLVLGKRLLRRLRQTGSTGFLFGKRVGAFACGIVFVGKLGFLGFGGGKAFSQRPYFFFRGEQRLLQMHRVVFGQTDVGFVFVDRARQRKDLRGDALRLQLERHFLAARLLLGFLQIFLRLVGFGKFRFGKNQLGGKVVCLGFRDVHVKERERHVHRHFGIAELQIFFRLLGFLFQRRQSFSEYARNIVDTDQIGLRILQFFRRLRFLITVARDPRRFLKDGAAFFVFL